tara:strand:+ start:1125 stop:1448 length:324 start_codon:yes stop_codon:yes gene_type:complete
MIIFPRLFQGTNPVPGPMALRDIIAWSGSLIQALDSFRNEVFSTYPRIDKGRGISLEGRIRLNSTLSDPDSIVDPLVGEMRYNQSSDKFQGYVADTGGGSPGWVDLH